MSDELKEKLEDTIVGEMKIVRDLINDRDRWKCRAKTYQKLCEVLLVANVAMVSGQMMRRRMKNQK